MQSQHQNQDRRRGDEEDVSSPAPLSPFRGLPQGDNEGFTCSDLGGDLYRRRARTVTDTSVSPGFLSRPGLLHEETAAGAGAGDGRDVLGGGIEFNRARTVSSPGVVGSRPGSGGANNFNRTRTFSSPGDVALGRPATTTGSSGMNRDDGGLGGIDLSSLSFGSVTPTGYTSTSRISEVISPSPGAGGRMATTSPFAPISSPSRQLHHYGQHYSPYRQSEPISPMISPYRYNNNAVESSQTPGSTPTRRGFADQIEENRKVLPKERSAPPLLSVHHSSALPVGEHQRGQEERYFAPSQLSIPTMSSNDISSIPQGLRQTEPLQSPFRPESMGDENHVLWGNQSDPSFAYEQRVGTSHGNGRPSSSSSSGSSKAKLFVGQVPKSCNESDLIPIFGPFGPLADIAIIRDRCSLGHRGCAFVTFQNADDAKRAIENVHDKVKFESSKLPLQVRVATVHGENPANRTGESRACGML